MSNRFYKAAAVLFCGILVLPLFQRITRLLPEPDLAGVELPVPQPVATASNWFSGTFQRQFEDRLIRRIGYRGLLVRIDNQIQYSLFNQPALGRGTRIVIGQDRWLFEQTYLDRYNSGRTAAEEDNRDRMRKLVRLERQLRQRGKGFLVVVSPSKAELYSEYLPPDKVVPDRHLRSSDYDRLAPLLDEYGVPWMDVPRHFRALKQAGAPPLFAKGGVHWNYYGAALVVTGLIDRLERQMGLDFAQVRVEGPRIDNEVFGTDNDLGDLLNILTWRWEQGPQVHPVLARLPEASARPARLLLVGDSFVFTLTYLMQSQGLVSESVIFYYSRRRFDYPAGTDAPIDPTRLDWEAEIGRVDAVVLAINEYWLPKIGFGMVEPALESLERNAPPPDAAPVGETR